MLFTNAEVNVKRAVTTTSTYGDTTRDWDNATYAASALPAEIQFQGTTEQTDQRKQIVNLYRCLLPVGTDVRSTDRIEWNGDDYEVDGEPAVWSSALCASTDHVRLVLMEVRA
jgi:hypothetical protein